MTKPLTREDDAPLVYDYKEAARLLGISEATLRRRIRDGEIERVTVFGRPRVLREEIMKFCAPPTPVFPRKTVVKRRDPEFVYVIRSGAYVKIGAATDITSRRNALQSGSPEKLNILAKLAGGFDLEKRLHERFLKQRHRREWFREEGELAAWIAEGCPT